MSKNENENREDNGKSILALYDFRSAPSDPSMDSHTIDGEYDSFRKTSNG